MKKLLLQEDAISYIIEYLKIKDVHGYTTYGYDLYLPNTMKKWCEENHVALKVQQHEAQQFLPDASPVFYEAAWELCRIGVLRPGIQNWGKQSTADGSAGNGYSITPFGKQWLQETDKKTFVPTEPGRFAEMMSPYADAFGPGFHERANQAIRCYGAHAYLACCVMCGAAVESVLLNLAISKTGDEAEVLRQYKASNGRKAIENIIVGQQKVGVKNDFDLCFALLKYWRDEAAHGQKSSIAESEAYTSLALLLRCAQFAKDNYEILTGKKLP